MHQANMVQGNIGGMLLRQVSSYKVGHFSVFIAVWPRAFPMLIRRSGLAIPLVTVDASTLRAILRSDLDNQVCCLHVLNRLFYQWHSKLRHDDHSGYLEHLTKAIYQQWNCDGVERLPTPGR